MNSLEYKKLSPEEMKSRGILGRLIGVCADFIHPTRNDRKYTEELWEKVFNNNIMKEKLANKVCYGELGHPVDREEIDMEKVAVCLAEQPQKGKDGKLRAVFDILDTPNGRILKTLCNYGSTLGISSRGTGDVVEDYNGDEIVDPDTYDCECFDVVIIPAVKEARLSYVNESLSSNKKKELKVALKEQLNKATEEERKVMEQTLNELSIDLEDKDLDESGYDSEKRNNINEETSKEDSDSTEEAKNNGSEELIKSLQEALKEKALLEAKVQDLQNKIAVSDTKVNGLNEQLAKHKEALARTSTMVINNKHLAEQVSQLEGELKSSKQTIVKKDSLIEHLRKVNSKLTSEKTSLNESVTKGDTDIKSLKEQMLKEKKETAEKLDQLNEQLENLKADSELQNKELTKKLTQKTNLIEKYKKAINVTFNRYIETKAKTLGVSVNRIKSELNESYTIDDIDRICEGLQSQYVNMSKLPFHLTEKTKGKIVESKNDNLRLDNGIDDDVDESLYRMANLNN